MKNSLLITIAAAFASVILFIFLDACENTVRQKIVNNANNEKETIEFESSKSFSAIKIVNIVDTLKAVDAFGNKLKNGDWYIQSNITRSVFPINTRSTNYTNLDWLMNNGNKELARVKITNGEPLGAYVDAEILLLGDKQLVLNNLEQYQVVSIK